MRDLRTLENYRLRTARIMELFGSHGDNLTGAFGIKSPVDAKPLLVIASSGLCDDSDGWDHVSVSHPRRIPNWIEMEYVKRLLFADDECCVQFHVPVQDHINCHPRCLHIWRKIGYKFPRPPSIMVGPNPEAIATNHETETMNGKKETPQGEEVQKAESQKAQSEA